jgi:MYXO-CTERM domain-containing protein
MTKQLLSGMAASLIALATQAATGSGPVSELAFDVTGAATVQIQSSNAATANFGPAVGTSGAEAHASGGNSELGVGASATSDASGMVGATISAFSYTHLEPGTVVSGFAEATWSATLVNIYPEVRSFTVMASGLNDGQLNLGGYDSVLKFDGHSANLSGLYGSTISTDIGTLAPGAGIDVTLTTRVDGRFVVESDSFLPGFSTTSIGLAYESQIVPVPEPASAAMGVAGLVALIGWVRRRQPAR